jgi:hypothetical protein
MEYPLMGYHHITACAAVAQEDVTYFTQAVGFRMAKQTVLMDGWSPTDEPAGTLGQALHLPPWMKDRWDEIRAQLDPIVVPETATSAS